VAYKFALRSTPATSISEKEAAVLTFYDNGMIRNCNQAAEKLLDCSTSELTGQSISGIFPELEKIMLIHGKWVNSCLRFLSRIGHSKRHNIAIQ
jgi:nitrogen fixation/metabolism regulation signal transduction histidine kinase